MNEKQNSFRRWPYAAILAGRAANLDRCDREYLMDSKQMGSRLCIAVLRGDNRQLEQLLDFGAPINHQDEPDGWTPLIYSIYYDNPAGRHILLARGADPMITDFSGKTALMFAAINGDVHLTADLLTRGLSPDAVDNNGKTALDFAEEYHNRECLTLLNMLTAANRK